MPRRAAIDTGCPDFQAMPPDPITMASIARDGRDVAHTALQGLNAMRRLRLPLLFLAMASSIAWAGQVYEWTDANGKRHFSDTPPAGIAAKPTGIRTSAPKPSTQSAGGAAQSTS